MSDYEVECLSNEIESYPDNDSWELNFVNSVSYERAEAVAAELDRIYDNINFSVETSKMGQIYIFATRD
jgi:hypothetical protein